MQMLERGRGTRVGRSLVRRRAALAASVLALACALPAVAAETVYARADDVIVRQSPSLAAPEVARLAAGESMLSHGGRGGWRSIDVEVAGQKVSGWVHEDEISAEPPASRSCQAHCHDSQRGDGRGTRFSASGKRCAHIELTTAAACPGDPVSGEI